MQWFDVVVILATIIIVSVFGIWKTRSPVYTDASQFVVGSGASAFSVGLSVASGFISSISLLGFPSEVFYNGAMIGWYLVMYTISFPIVAYVFLPVIYNLRLTSAYEYFQLRFNRTCRTVASLLFCTEIIFYNAVALYAPSLAISSLFDISVLSSIIMTALLSSAYISLGGAKAGIYTSAVQMLVIFLAMTLVVVLSLWKEDIGVIYKNVVDGHRLDIFDFRVDPRIRHSVPSLLIGGTGTILALFAANQMSLQKYMSMPTLQSAQKVVLLNIPFNFFILSMYLVIGFVIFGVYHDCIPVLSNKNEILPFYVLDRLSSYPGMTGLFSVAIYSAGISTLSSTFAAANAVFIEDIVTPMRILLGLPPLRDEQSKKIMRYFPILLALLEILLAYSCTYFGSFILQLAFSIFGIVGGPVLGCFVLGILVPFVRDRAASVAIIMSTLTSFGTAIVALTNRVGPVPLPLNTQCLNESFSYAISDLSVMNTVTDIHGWSIMQFFRLSYQYYSFIGVIVSLFVGISVQLVLGPENTPVDPRLLSPLVVRNKTVPVPETVELPIIMES